LENFKTYLSNASNDDVYKESNKELAFVFGNEVEGVSDEVLAICDGAIEIPQYGMKHSLNISVAAAIVLWEMVR
jgi:tRNA G18 (ribose-2'-O)-methylase SpoU